MVYLPVIPSRHRNTVPSEFLTYAGSSLSFDSTFEVLKVEKLEKIENVCTTDGRELGWEWRKEIRFIDNLARELDLREFPIGSPSSRARDRVLPNLPID